MFWPLISAAGFVGAVVLVIALARARTARWERERAVEEARVRRRRALERARLARSGMLAASSVRRRAMHRPRAGGGSGGPEREGRVGTGPLDS
jgi:hypothetical protein